MSEISPEDVHVGQDYIIRPPRKPADKSAVPYIGTVVTVLSKGNYPLRTVCSDHKGFLDVEISLFDGRIGFACYCALQRIQDPDQETEVDQAEEVSA